MCSGAEIGPPLVVRRFRPGDHRDCDELLRAGFPTGEEAELVAELRRGGDFSFELVARVDRIVGHIVISAGKVEQRDGAVNAVWCLGPVVVAENHRRRGIGGTLIHAACAVAESSASGEVPIFVLGSDGYYPRFGFRPAVPLGYWTWFLGEPGSGDVPASAFMVRAIEPAALRGGLVHYHEAFDRFLPG